MSIELVIDNREKHLIEMIGEHGFIKVETLTIGDIVFRQGSETLFIIERKTIADLKASICDGRNREQKARILGSGVKKEKIMYIIEGNINKPLTEKVSGMPISTLVGSMINTQLRDGIKIYKTVSLFETSQFLLKLYDKLKKDVNTFFNGDVGVSSVSVVDYIATIKKKKKDNINANVWFISQLSLIPQITEKIAKEIVVEYKTVSNLILSYEKLDVDNRKNMLEDITYPLKTGKTRRIGAKISERVFNLIYGIS
jgi:crossover junction endonuclease MUS81